MTPELKIPYAEKDGQLVHVDTVERGLAAGCVCPVCHATVLARKGSKVVHHFAHHQAHACDGETVLHQVAKRLLAEKISAALAGSNAFPMRWKCSQCGDEHEGNLVKKAAKVRLEMSFGEFRPDLALLSSDDALVAAVEVVVTHKPENNALDYCSRKRIPLVIWQVKDSLQMEPSLKADVFEPDSVSRCLRPKCQKCGRMMNHSKFYVFPAPCWRCKKEMMVAFAVRDEETVGPEHFLPEETETARAKGVLAERRHSKTMGRTYRMNVCSHCHAFIGEHYQYDYYELLHASTPVRDACFCQDCGTRG